jgi:hypothetical protein
MIPYDELCAALDRWRQAHGPPANRARARAETTPAPAVLEATPPPAVAQSPDSIVNLSRRTSAPIPVQAAPRDSGRVMAPAPGRGTEPVAIAPPPDGPLTPALAVAPLALAPEPLPPPPEPEPLPPPMWAETSDATIDEPSHQDATLVGSLPIADLAPPDGSEFDVDSIDVLDENDA